MRRRAIRVVAIGAVAAFSVAACGGGGGGSDRAEISNAGAEDIVRETDEKGGTLKFAVSDDFDSIDPGNTYYAFSNNFLRNYSRMLMTYTSAPGEEGLTPVPDLAEAPGEPSDGNKTWTYKLQDGLKYEDGSAIKAEDIKHAVARTFDREVLPNGPAYFTQLLVGAGKYKGPFKDKNLDNFKGISTPDDKTVVFHLNEPFSEFNELVMFSGQTAPVPPAKDKGKKYQDHPISSGPYMWDGNYKPGEGGTLVRNPHWDAETDPHRKALPDEITIKAGVDANEVDNQLFSGDVQMDLAGSGVQENARKSVVTNQDRADNADSVLAGFHWYIPINSKTIPNVECRKAIVYAADRDAIWRAFGGDLGGEFATSIMPPNIAGREAPENAYAFDDEIKASELKPGYKGDVEKAKEALEKCGKADGFDTTMLFRSDRPKEKDVAEAMQQGLKRVGINLSLKGYPAGTYTNEQLGAPSFVKKNNVGIGTYGWAPDWPTGYGYLQPLTDGDAILDRGNTNISEVADKEIDKMWDEVVKVEDVAERETMYNEIDQKVLEQAMILPTVYAKSLLYRPESATNVYFHQGFGMYDYANMGVAE